MADHSAHRHGLRVLALTRYPRTGSTSRLRFLQYLPALHAAGVQVDVAPLWTQRHLDELYAGTPPSPWRVASAYCRRLAGLLQVARYDVVWLETEVFPYLPSFAERAIASRGVPLVLDLDDAVFHKYDHHRHLGVRLALGKKIDSAMKRARVVVAGSPYLEARARAAGATRVELIPTVVDLGRYPPAAARSHTPPRVVWIGTSHNRRYLDEVAEPLRELSRDGCLKVTLIGAGEPKLPFPYRALAWHEDTEVEALRRCDIGIMPLPDTPFERGKCGYKLIQYMACGLPVVASPVGINATLVRTGVTGFLAARPSEWRDALLCLAREPALRSRLGACGRSLVEESYSLDVTAPRLAALFRSL
ncbi:MAG: glycosyltransferase family 4 protein [Myxococcota bacterium]